MSHLNDIKKWIYEPASSDVQAKRIAICKCCDKYVGAIHLCSMCKCLVDAKTRLAHTRCPLNKWLEVE